jgi:hypothetical protein
VEEDADEDEGEDESEGTDGPRVSLADRPPGTAGAVLTGVVIIALFTVVIGVGSALLTIYPISIYIGPRGAPGGPGPSGPPPPVVYPSPEAVWDACVKARQANEAMVLMACFTDEDQKDITVRRVFEVIHDRLKGKKEVQRVIPVLDKHGFTDAVCRQLVSVPAPEALTQIASRIKDPAVLWSEMFKADWQVAAMNIWNLLDGDLVNVKIDGDKATGEVQFREIFVDFVKVGDGWRMRIPRRVKR